METKKTLAIINATGHPGSGIAARLAKSPYRLLLMSEDGRDLVRLQKKLLKLSGGIADIITNDCAREASWEADIIISATPPEANNTVAEKIRDVAVGKIVISISGPTDITEDKPVSSGHSSAAENLQALLPHSTVVKTFNTTFAADFFTPLMKGERADSFIAGNNSDALNEVSNLIRSAGFNPVVVGDLSMSSALEQLQRVLIRMANSNNQKVLAGAEHITKPIGNRL